MTRTKIVIGAIVVAGLSRVLPHPPSFTPLLAMGLFGGACLACRWQAVVVTLAALFLSDLALEVTTRVPGLYAGWLAGGSGLHAGWWVVYGSYLIPVGIGMLIRNRRSALNVAAGALVSSTLIFLVVDFAEWAFNVRSGLVPYYDTNGIQIGVRYIEPWTLSGLITIYEMAIPFWIDPRHWWKSPLFGDVLYTGILFGGYALAEKWVLAIKPMPSPALATQKS